MSENYKSEQIESLFIKSRSNWLKLEPLERPETDTIEQLYTLDSQQTAMREICDRNEYCDEGINETTESNSETML